MRDAFKRLFAFLYVLFLFHLVYVFILIKAPFPLKKGAFFEFIYLINQSFIFLKNDTKERSVF